MKGIGISIFWGPWGGELKPLPLVTFGEGTEALAPEAPSLVKEDQVWMIANNASRSVYSLYAKVPCINPENAIQLLISFTMSKTSHLANKSPLDLLDALKAQFERLFIVNVNEVRPRSGRVDVAFRSLLANYPLESCPWYVFTMEGLEPGAFRVEDRNQLNALMRFNAYPALAHIEHLELGFNCKTTVEVNTKGESKDNANIRKRQWRWKREKLQKNVQPIQSKQQNAFLQKKLADVNAKGESNTKKQGEKQHGVLERIDDGRRGMFRVIVDYYYNIFNSNNVWNIYGFLGKAVTALHVILIILLSWTLFYAAKTYVVKPMINKLYTHLKQRIEIRKELFAFSNCSTVVDYHQFVKDYPNGINRIKADSIIECFVRDSIVEKEKLLVEKDNKAYQAIENLRYFYLDKCINDCNEYIQLFPSGIHRDDVDSLKAELIIEIETEEYVCFRICMDSLYPKNYQACEDYLKRYYGMRRDMVLNTYTSIGLNRKILLNEFKTYTSLNQ